MPDEMNEYTKEHEDWVVEDGYDEEEESPPTPDDPLEDLEDLNSIGC